MADDDFLDDALDSFQAPAKPAAAVAPTDAEEKAEPSEEFMDEEFAKQLAAGMEQLMKGLGGEGLDGGDVAPEEFKAAMDQILLNSMKSLNVKDEGPSTTSGGSQKVETPAVGGSFKTKISETLHKMRDSSDKVDAQIAEGAPGLDEAGMEQMMKDLEAMMGGGDFENMFEGLMEQIMSKELLYEPMKDLAEKYPGWLAANKSKVSTEDFERYEKQLKIIQEIMGVYDLKLGSEEEGKRVVELMQKMQECGNPPEEIMQELAPGLELGTDGLPKLPPGFGGV
ncbi:Peroxisome chaperone and import receptor [Phlyctochytrium planicorne]|nr:Peroxisome chaperone and import receptor [Phlyctochytrium planicorne]